MTTKREVVKVPVEWRVDYEPGDDGNFRHWKIEGRWVEPDTGRYATTGERCAVVYRRRDVRPALAELRRSQGDWAWASRAIA